MPVRQLATTVVKVYHVKGKSEVLAVKSVINGVLDCVVFDSFIFIFFRKMVIIVFYKTQELFICCRYLATLVNRILF